MQKYAICNKTSKYAKLCNTRFGFWGPRDLIRKEPEFEAPSTFQIHRMPCTEECFLSLSLSLPWLE